MHSENLGGGMKREKEKMSIKVRKKDILKIYIISVGGKRDWRIFQDLKIFKM